MKIVKVRRVGNSNVVSIPREFEASGYTPGSSVLVEDVGDGELRILPTDRLRRASGGKDDMAVQAGAQAGSRCAGAHHDGLQRAAHGGAARRASQGGAYGAD